MMALPYITEHTGFTGTVYATEPTLQIGRYRDNTGRVHLFLLNTVFFIGECDEAVVVSIN